MNWWVKACLNVLTWLACAGAIAIVVAAVYLMFTVVQIFRAIP